MSPVAGLLDTNILIDILRGYDPAVQWMQSHPDLVLGIPSLVRMEIVLGTNDKPGQERMIKLLSPYPVVLISEADSQWAMHQFEQFHLSNQIEIIDCFIAATSVRLRVPLYTRNLKDMRVFPDLHLISPY